jgi:hypothetical protein
MASHASNQENSDDVVLNHENLGEGFFFANFLPLTFEKLRPSKEANEGLKSCHDFLLCSMNLQAYARPRGKRVQWEGAQSKLGEFL